MDKILEIAKFVGANYQAIITAVVAVLAALVGLFTLIPGDQPEKALQGIVDFLSKFSAKPAVKAEEPKA